MLADPVGVLGVGIPSRCWIHSKKIFVKWLKYLLFSNCLVCPWFTWMVKSVVKQNDTKHWTHIILLHFIYFQDKTSLNIKVLHIEILVIVKPGENTRYNNSTEGSLYAYACTLYVKIFDNLSYFTLIIEDFFFINWSITKVAHVLLSTHFLGGKYAYEPWQLNY